MIRKKSLLNWFALFLVLPSLRGAVIPVTDSNFVSSLTLNDWVTTSDAVNATINGASFTVGFRGTRNVVLLVDNSHLSGAAASRCPIIAWAINGGPWQNHQLVVGETSVTLASGVTNPIIDFYVKGMSPFEDRYNGDVPKNSVVTRLVVAQITPYSSYTAAIVKYNNYIGNVLVPYFAGRGKLVSTVNQYTNLCFPRTTDIDTSLFANGINHPNPTAYNRMAQTRFAGLQQINLATSLAAPSHR